MQAILLATGENQRLKPLSERLPVPLLPLADRPMMAYSLELLKRAGFRKILVCLSQMSASIESYFGTGTRWGFQLDYILLRDAWGSAGALRWIERLIQDDFIVLPADTIVDVDLNAVCQRHLKQKSIATVVVHSAPRERNRRLWLDEQEHVVAYVGDRPDEAAWYDTGIYLFGRRALDFIPVRTKFDIHSQLLPRLHESGVEIQAYPTQGYWNPLASFHSFYEAQQVFFAVAQGYQNLPPEHSMQRQPLPRGRQISRGIWVGRNFRLHKSAVLTGPICIGENSWIGRGVELGPEVVIGSNVVIDNQATIRHSIILDHTYIGHLVNVENRIVYEGLVIDIPTGESVQIVDPFLISQAYPTILSKSALRLFELVVVLILLVLTLPLTVLLAGIAWLATGAIFTQVEMAEIILERTGKSEVPCPIKTYRLLRFNTSRADGQKTRLGKWLKQWELDRLPELLNVLVGDLRLVGVMPLTEEQTCQAKEPWQRKRFEFQPGFTGLWYVQTRMDGSLDEILVTDGYYVSTRNWGLDLRLAWQTPAVWLRRIVNPVVTMLPISLVERTRGD